MPASSHGTAHGDLGEQRLNLSHTDIKGVAYCLAKAAYHLVVASAIAVPARQEAYALATGEIRDRWVSQARHRQL